MQTSFWRLISLAVVAVFAMAIVPVIIKMIQVNAWIVGFVRLAIAVVGLFIFAKLINQSVWSQRKNWLPITIIGFIFSIHWLTYFYSIQFSTAAIAAIGVSTYGAHLLLLGWFFKGQQPSLFEFACVVTAFIGVYFIVPEFSLENEMTLGLILGVVSGFLYACLPLLHQKYNTINNQRRAFGQFFIAMLVFAVALPFLPQSTLELSSEAWWGLAAMGVFSTLIGHTLWVKVTTELNHVVTSIVYYLYVPLAMLLSFFVLNEAMTSNKIIGASLILSANLAGIIYRSRRLSS
ncbi:DMT family transporter [Kangiella sp. HZ709]|uniref:DMT family transporter n=1 Tax=Kangiella sp. HZ709 TaxID=2666328 RepID=UPI0012B0A862|nr:DMT family transporter [Kangiella sp. HZ709]MRX26976.1 EamA family transporter [Kangiella sp. HZ709]